MPPTPRARLPRCLRHLAALAATGSHLGGITIEDDVQIDPKVNLLTENYPTDPAQRKTLLLSPVLLKRNAWIGAAATTC